LKNIEINRILEIDESFKLPKRLMEILLDEKEKNRIMDEFMKIGEGLDYDWFTEYFEEEHSNKTKMHQDFTPKSVTDIIKEMCGKAERIADICAGTGGLTIATWNNNPAAWFHCEEISERAVPILLLNMAVRNMRGEVVQCDCLNRQISAVYKLGRGEKYSRIYVSETTDDNQKFDLVVQNPPYSLPWKYDKNKKDERMIFGYPPTSRADYGFIQYGLWLLNESGTMISIVPHGVLFRGARELEIRKSIIESGMLRSVIGLPDHLFLNTDIPTCIMEFKKSETVLFVDSSKNYRKDKKTNVMEHEHINRILECLRARTDREKFSHVALKTEIVENDYNLNIPRYVDTYEPEPVPDPVETLQEYFRICKEIEKTETELLKYVEQMHGTDGDSEMELKQIKKILRENTKKTNYKQEVLHFE
jgi:type I restriction enzyme M protein